MIMLILYNKFTRALIDRGYSMSLDKALQICEEESLFSELVLEFPLNSTGFNLSLMKQTDKDEISRKFQDLPIALRPA